MHIRQDVHRNRHFLCTSLAGIKASFNAGLRNQTCFRQPQLTGDQAGQQGVEQGG
jgi:hypothetical protein